MQSLSKNNIVLIFVGESHCDPSPVGLVNNYMKIFSEAKLNQIYCTENHYTLTKKQKLDSEQMCKQQIGMILENKDIKNLAIHKAGIKRPTYPLGEFIVPCLQKILPLTLPQINYVANRIRQFHHTMEELNLTHTLIQKKVPLVGIEDLFGVKDKDHVVAGVKASQLSKQQTSNLEYARIKGMIERIFKAALKCENAIIWVHTGAAHTQNLAASSLHYIQQKNLMAKHSFTVLPIICTSLYSDKAVMLETMAHHKEAFLNVHSEAKKLSPLYEKNIYQLIDDTVEDDSLTFHSVTMDKLMLFVQQSYHKKNIFYLPIGPNQQALIESNYGKIIEIKEPYLIIKIASELLLQPLREQLGIDRKKLTLVKDSVAVLKALHEHPEITIEPQIESNQVLVTFPKKHLSIINQALKR